MPDSAADRLSSLELASGVITGRSRTTGSNPSGSSTSRSSPLAALEASVLAALQRPPCLVSFSGGMDSSFVLAVAARVARLHGLALPIPVTWRFTDAPRAEESQWQERVVAGLAIEDWSTLLADDDLDLVGPVAQRMLVRHGVLYPHNTHLHAPIISMAGGGSVLTGVGGDQVLCAWRRPGRRTPVRALRAHVPDAVAARARQRRDDPFPWLLASASRRVLRSFRREAADEPRDIDRRIAWHTRRRALQITCASLETIAADEDVLLINPLLDRDVVDALRRRTRGLRVRSRHELLVDIGEAKLPDVATAHRPKAHFLEVFLRSPTRDFVQAWDGTGADPAVVDTERLRDVWSRWPIPGTTAGLVQQLWLRHAISAAAEPSTMLMEADR